MLNVNINIKQGDFRAGFNFEIQHGITGVFGDSGNGKTSLLNAICGILKPESGAIFLNNKTLFSSDNKINVPVQKRHIGYVFQDYKLFPHYSVFKNLKYALPKREDVKKVYEIANLLGIEHLLDKQPLKCSGGEKQRIAIGRALLSNPELLLMDEPFAAIDVKKREELMQYIKRVAETYKLPILIVSHDFQDMLKLMDSVLCLENGSISYQGDIFQVLSNADFISNEKLFNNYQNILILNVAGPRQTSGKVLYETVNKPTGMRFLIESFTDLKPESEVRIVLSPDDIVMATRPVYEISTSNQICGTLLRVIESPYMVKCVVDVGFHILVSITANAYDRLGFSLGDKVWLQFKTTKLNVTSNHYNSSAKLRIA